MHKELKETHILAKIILALLISLFFPSTQAADITNQEIQNQQDAQQLCIQQRVSQCLKVCEKSKEINCAQACEENAKNECRQAGE